MRWFGEAWGAKFNRRALHAATPVGVICAGCERPIEMNAQGFLAEVRDLGGGEAPFHRHCFYESIGIKQTIHILKYGLPLCRFSAEVPARWPNGHVWTPKHVWTPNRNESSCDGCKREYDAQHVR